MSPERKLAWTMTGVLVGMVVIIAFVTDLVTALSCGITMSVSGLAGYLVSRG